jgi:hypothetical protein
MQAGFHETCLLSEVDLISGVYHCNITASSRAALNRGCIWEVRSLSSDSDDLPLALEYRLIVQNPLRRENG